MKINERLDKAKKEKPRTLTIYAVLNADVHKGVTDAAKKHGITRAEFVRIAIEQSLEDLGGVK